MCLILYLRPKQLPERDSPVEVLSPSLRGTETLPSVSTDIFFPPLHLLLPGPGQGWETHEQGHPETDGAPCARGA